MGTNRGGPLPRPTGVPSEGGRCPGPRAGARGGARLGRPTADPTPTSPARTPRHRPRWGPPAPPARGGHAPGRGRGNESAGRLVPRRGHQGGARVSFQWQALRASRTSPLLRPRSTTAGGEEGRKCTEVRAGPPRTPLALSPLGGWEGAHLPWAGLHRGLPRLGRRVHFSPLPRVGEACLGPSPVCVLAPLMRFCGCVLVAMGPRWSFPFRTGSPAGCWLMARAVARALTARYRRT